MGPSNAFILRIVVLQRPEIKTSSSQHNLTVIKVSSLQRYFLILFVDAFRHAFNRFLWIGSFNFAPKLTKLTFVGGKMLTWKVTGKSPKIKSPLATATGGPACRLQMINNFQKVKYTL